MRKKRVTPIRNIQHDAYDWLPIESWLVPSFHFTHVHGLARIFLITEIVLSLGVVFGVLVLSVLHTLL